MTVQQTIDALFAQLDRGIPMQDIMRANERAAGYRVVVPGDEPWLSAADWHSTITVSVDRHIVRLVAILANNPGSGAFRRTVRSIIAAGLTPCVIEPTHEMRTTLKRWNWKCKRKGCGLNSEEQWMPRKSFSI